MEDPPMRKAPDRRVDLVKHSLDHLLALTFAQSRAPSYSLAASLVRGCRLHEEILVGNQLVHFAVFEKTLADAGRALAVLGYLQGSKTLQVFARGRHIRSARAVLGVLECYVKASQCSDRTAHCHKVVRDPFEPVGPQVLTTTIRLSLGPTGEDEPGSRPVDAYLVPCAYAWSCNLNLQKAHPATPEDQIQARGVSLGCDLCPFFKPGDFRKIGTEMRIKGRTFLWPEEDR